MTQGRGTVFVVGMNGSGTTMLADSLGRHPDLYMLPLESKVLPYFIQRSGKYGDLRIHENRRRLADELGRCKAYWQANGKRNMVVPDGHLAGEGLAGIIEGLYLQLAAREGKARWGDKSPVNTIHITELARLFPEARFVHIVRDGRDAAQSFHRRWGYDPLHTITRWKNTVLAGQRQGRALESGRYLEVKYESLTAAPENEMRCICKFLGLDFDPVVMQSSMKYLDPNDPKSNVGRIIENSGKWRSYFNHNQIQQIESIAGKVLTSFGYPVVCQGDMNPGALKRKYWLLKDGISATTSFFRKFGLKALPMYLRTVRDAVKQFVAGMQ